VLVTAPTIPGQLALCGRHLREVAGAGLELGVREISRPPSPAVAQVRLPVSRREPNPVIEISRPNVSPVFAGVRLAFRVMAAWKSALGLAAVPAEQRV